MKSMLIVLAVFAVTGCKASDEHKEMQSAPSVSPQAATASVAPITVERVGLVKDSIAYNDCRGVYIIRDKRTGKEYIGVSGVGISEVGTHMLGKTTQEDER